jgi:hypothetical protein
MSIFWRRHSRLIGADSHSIVWTEVADTAARLALSLTSNDDGKVVKQTDDSSLWVIVDYTGPTYVEITAIGVAAVTSVFGEVGDVTLADADLVMSDITDLSLAGLDDDFIIKYDLGSATWVVELDTGGGGGVTDHGALTGLGDDDHTAYLNTGRHGAIGSNPHGVTKTQVSLGNAENTADTDKPISDATQTALDDKLDETSHDALPSDNPHDVDATDVGLGNVDNTADTDKPVSTDQQAEIDVFRGASSGIGAWAFIGSSLEVPSQGEFSTDSANPNTVTEILIAYQSEYTVGARAIRQAVAGDVITFRSFSTTFEYMNQHLITSVVDPNDGNPITINVDNSQSLGNGSTYGSDLYGVDLFAPQGESVVGLGTFEYDGVVVSTTDPTAGKWTRDHATDGSVTRMDISYSAIGGLDVSEIFATLTVGSHFYFRLNDGEAQTYVINGSGVTDRTTYYDIDVAHVENSTSWPGLTATDIHSLLPVPSASAVAPEGVDVKSSGPVTATWNLTADGDGTSSWQPPGSPTGHLLGGTSHTADSLANFNSKVTGGNLDFDTAQRDPTTHALDSGSHSGSISSAQHGVQSDVTLHADATGSLDGFMPSGDKTKVDHITVTQAVDLDTIETDSLASKVVTDWITITQAVNLDTMETDSLASKVITDWIAVTQDVDLDDMETDAAASKVITDFLTVTGAVDLDAMEIDAAASKVVTDWISVTQAVDLDVIETDSLASKVITDWIAVTQAVDLDDIETNSAASKVITDWITVTQAVDLDAMETSIGALGTASVEDIGTTIGDVVGVVDTGGAVSGLDAIDGSLLTGMAWHDFTYITPASGDPGSGNWTMEDSTTLLVSVTANNGLDIGVVFGSLGSGASVYVKTAGEVRLYTVSAVADLTTWLEITVALDSSSTGFALSTGEDYSFLGSGGGGGGGSGDITSVVAGDGLTGGATSGDATLDVVANGDASIVVNADDIQVGVLATDGQHGVRGGGTQHADVIAGGADGFMTGADKTKLDGVEADAKDDQDIGAGAGLIGGGLGDAELNVGQGTGIIVNADDVEVGYGTITGTATEGNDARVVAGVAHRALTDEHIDWTGASAGTVHQTNLPAELKSELDTRIADGNLISDQDAEFVVTTGIIDTEKGTPVDADLLLIEDSAAGGAKKFVEIGNLPEQTITLEGDVTGTGTGTFTATIANDAVTLATMDAGTPGGVIAYDTTTGNPVDVGVGTLDQVLTTSTVGQPPTWEDPTGVGTATDLATDASPVAINSTAPAGAGYVLKSTDTTTATWQAAAGGGDVTGPGASVQSTSMAVYDGTGGLTIQEAPILVGVSTVGSGTRTAHDSSVLTGGYASGIGEIETTNSGTIALGYAASNSTGVPKILAGGQGAFATGYSFAFQTGDSLIEATGAGSFVTGGASNFEAADILISASGDGSFAGGYASTGGATIDASGDGALARGSITSTGTIEALGSGSFALGQVSTGTISASADGAIAIGVTTTGTISASGTNSMQVGVGSNAQNDSIQVGDTTDGIRLTAGGSAPTASIHDGDMWVDTTKFRVRDAGGDTNMVSSLSKSITIQDPVTAEDITLFYTPVAITITQIAAVIRGTTPSVLWFIKHATMTTGRDSAGTAVVTAGTTTTDEGGVSITSFDDATIPADSFLWVETTDVSGTNDELSLTVVYTED